MLGSAIKAKKLLNDFFYIQSRPPEGSTQEARYWGMVAYERGSPGTVETLKHRGFFPG